MNPTWNLGLLAWLLGHFAMAAYDARWSLMAWQVVFILLALTTGARLAQYKRWRGLA